MSCCSGNCGCGSGCKCGNGCGGCKMYSDMEITNAAADPFIFGVAPSTTFGEGAEMGVGSENGCKCGSSCSCANCGCSK